MNQNHFYTRVIEQLRQGKRLAQFIHLLIRLY